MQTTIQFENVSKQYRLGLTRTSLPSLISGWLKSLSQRQSHEKTRNAIFWALRDVSFELKSGDSLALVGANGAGKTTILKLLANITKPTSGKITKNGQLSALIELGAGFHPDLTGRENIYLNGTILGLSKKQIINRFDEIVSFAELDQFIDTPVKRYSSGMAVRLGFAVAASINPEILLVDEVLAVGDASFQQKCMQRINSLIDQGTSLIFVSHNLYLVQAVCKTGLYLEKGVVKHVGAMEDVIERYENDLHSAQDLKLSENVNGETDNEGSEIEITKVEILGEDESGKETLDNKKTAQIHIHYHAYRNFNKVNISVFIHRSDGMTCCMMRTKIDNFNLSVSRGSGKVTLLITPLQLVTGSYYVEAWFLNETDSLTITTKGVRSGWFSVKGNSLSYDNNNGVFEPHTQWKQE